jgi:[ribosomal protein S5]-alanine N-acetyltransferase
VRVRTERLHIRAMTEADAPFMLALLNEPSFIRNIGDRGVRTEEAARRYIAEGPLASYAQHGFGLCAVTLADTTTPIGICGLLKRDALPDPDIGFAFLPPYWSKGYAIEAASAVTRHARETLRLARLLAIVNPDNTGSIRLLEKLGFGFDRMIRISAGEPDLKLFRVEFES